jgi:NAD(P)-dependent dehydrogenase (short-subunit alcohol dehydrogenase family)
MSHPTWPVFKVTILISHTDALAILTAIDNIGGNTCYRLAKCALNNLTKTQSEDLKKISPNVITLAVHPGYVATKMTGFYGEDDMEECMTGFVQIVETFGSKGTEEKLPNGGYVRWNGERMNY